MSVERAKSVPPFVLWCTAMIPTAFDDSMSYYEALCALYKFIQDNLVEPINNNATILDQTVKDMATLKEYVDNYFDNLDVQEEINNKLDDMAEGGQLAAIIAEFLALSPVFGYSTISDMASATNLNDGCIARVLGNTDAADGDGAFYKVRTKESGESGDGVQKVEIGDTLIADRIVNATAVDLQNQIDELRVPTKKYLFVGDSYADGYTGEGQNTPWQEIVKTKLELDDSQFVSTHRGGFGFGRPSAYNYYLLINALVDDPDLTDIVIGGSYNDNGYTELEITNGITNVRTLCKTKFPNAKLHIAFIGWSKNKDAKTNLQSTYQYYKNACDLYADIDFMKNTQYVLHDYFNMFSSDGIHPNQTGQTAIANAICDCLLRGSTNVYYRRGFGLTPVNEGYLSGSWGTNSILDNGLCNVEWINTGTFNWSAGNAITLNGKGLVKIADINTGVIVGDNTYRTAATIPCVVQTTDNKYHSLMLNFAISAGGLYIQSNLVNDEGTAYGSMNIKVIQVDCLNISVPSIVA